MPGKIIEPPKNGGHRTMKHLTVLSIVTAIIFGLVGLGGATTQVSFAPDELQISSSGHSGSFSSDLAFDGDQDTRWVSSARGTEHWIQVEFPKELDFSGIHLDWANDNTRAQKIMISFSLDGTHWQDAFGDMVATTGLTESFSFASQRARFCRIQFAEPVRGNLLSVREISFAGIRIQEPFLKHVGVGSGSGESWLSSEGERLRVDVLLPIYTETFTWAFSPEQEYLVMENLVDYRDWVEQVIGHNLYEDYHLVLVDVPLSRSEIDGTDTFWLSPSDVWSNLGPTSINPGDYDLVWSLWAWKNIPGAHQRYGGAALDGPDATPFMSFSVSQFTDRSQGIIMVLEHEAHHTYESLFRYSGLVVDTSLPMRGMPHADFLDLDEFLGEMLRLEPGLFEPFMSDAEAMEYRRNGPKTWPGMTMQRTINAWTYRFQPREHWLHVAQHLGKLAPPREDIVVQPLFTSLAIVTQRGPQREVFLPVRVRNQGWHIPGVTVTATIDGQVYTLNEDTFYRYPGIRMPRQERWSAGWDGNAYYGAWVPLTQDTKQIEVQVAGANIDEEFIIPVNYLYVTTEVISLGPDKVHEGSALWSDDLWKIGEEDSVIFRIPNNKADTASIEVAGTGWLGVAVSANGRYFLSLWQDELPREPVGIGVQSEILRDQEYLYVRIQQPPSWRRKSAAPPVSEVAEIRVVFRKYSEDA